MPTENGLWTTESAPDLGLYRWARQGSNLRPKDYEFKRALFHNLAKHAKAQVRPAFWLTAIYR